MEALHPKRELPQPEQKSPAIADERKQSTPTPEGQQQQQQPASTPEETATQLHQKVKLRDVNSSLTCELCKGYLIDATTISECLHSFCRSCIIKFLQENSFCPVCEVIINKAKPNLKLDKTLQDIVYKLVPGLFLSEMMRRRHFYADKPVEAGRASPEQRGEDTERTIFNPQDRISLSLEYIGDAATTDLILKDLKQKQDDASKDALLKRYLQCPAMCRIDVIKKFIRNKYNVNTDLFQIDILYKRVPLPLPDHYTLIDVAYIYTWKRNEPMRFYFRIIDKGNDELPDLTKVFPPVDEDAPFLPKPLALSTPNKTSKRPATPPAREKSKKTPKRCVVSKKPPLARPAKKQKTEDEEKSSKKNEFDNDDDDDRGGKSASESESTTPKKTPAKTDVENGETPEPDSTLVKKETDAGVASEHCDNKVYTNITLNRSNNFEIVTKIQKLSDKDGQQIEVNIIDKSAWQKVECNVSRSNVAKEETSVETKTPERVKEEEPSPSKPSPNVDHEPEVTSTTNDPSPQVAAEEEELEKTKFEFLKSIELTAKKVVDNLAKLVQQQQQNNALAYRGQQNLQTPPKPEAKKQPKQETNGLKRKNSSPVKIESKRTKVEPKRTTKIILQQKPGYPPLNLTKPSEKAAAGPEELIKQNRNELRSLFQNCRLNIPSSLSITLKENGETSRQPVQMPPVQNFIEILKIDEASGTQTVTLKRDDAKKPEPNKQTVPSVPEQAKRKRKESTDKQKEQQSFQKIFEESIKKNGPEPEAPQCSSGKSKILEIAQQLYKKNKTTEHEAKKPPPPPPAASNPFVMTQKLQKIAIPRLNNQRVVKPPKRSQKYDNATHQTLANLHSSSLGLNYTVSVGKQTRDVMKTNGVVSQSKTVDSQSFGGCADQTKPNAAFPTQPGLVSPKTDSKAAFSPKPSLGSTNSPSGSPRVFSPQMSPKLGAKTPSPKPKPHLSPKPKPNLSPKPKPNVSPNPSVAGGSSTVPPLTANELLEKYNIQNLAQLSASMNFNAQAYLSSMSQKQMSTLHQSMLMKQLEMHSRQNWFNINQAPLLQYEKYLQTLGASKNQQIMGNLKDN